MLESLIQACRVSPSRARKIRDIWNLANRAGEHARHPKQGISRQPRPEWVITMPKPPKLREDVEGYDDLKPDPLTATTKEEFLQHMRDFHVWAKELSYREISRGSGRAVAASTLCEALNPNKRPRLPSMKVVEGFITGCGGSEDDLVRWTTAWRRIRMAKAHSNVTRLPSSCRTAS
ncbi:hypothetical protein [Microtetraspora sp. NBRC 16547]|uniref:hypothetical protein n=1 Tax=Microtetraspora sp. NBRC 16547 TaxID=3030993 RepID=UPI0025522930|nr:hypothetical protein [Microtetraspora sp. NBRC 16547]